MAKTLKQLAKERGDERRQVPTKSGAPRKGNGALPGERRGWPPKDLGQKWLSKADNAGEVSEFERDFRARHIVPYKFDDDTKARFLALYRDTGVLGTAARMAGISYQTVKNHMKEDEAFRLAVEEAQEMFKSIVMETWHERAIVGWMDPVFDKDGHQCGEVFNYDRGALSLLIKRHEPVLSAQGGNQTNVNIRASGVLVVSEGYDTMEEFDAATKDLKLIEDTSDGETK